MCMHTRTPCACIVCNMACAQPCTCCSAHAFTLHERTHARSMSKLFGLRLLVQTRLTQLFGLRLLVQTRLAAQTQRIGCAASTHTHTASLQLMCLCELSEALSFPCLFGASTANRPGRSMRQLLSCIDQAQCSNSHVFLLGCAAVLHTAAQFNKRKRAFFACVCVHSPPVLHTHACAHTRMRSPSLLCMCV